MQNRREEVEFVEHLLSALCPSSHYLLKQPGQVEGNIPFIFRKLMCKAMQLAKDNLSKKCQIATLYFRGSSSTMLLSQCRKPTNAEGKDTLRKRHERPVAIDRK
jgi:hypothetical protein